MSLNASAIVTLAETKTYMKVTEATTFDSLIEGFINTSSEYIEQLIGGKVVLRDVLCILDGSGGDSLFPPYPRMVSLVGTSTPERLANLQARSSFSGAWMNLFSAMNQFTIIDEPAIKNFHRHLRRLDGSYFPFGTQNIRLFYRDGFQTIPEVFTQCALEMCEVMWRESPYGNNELNKAEISTSFEGQSGTTKLKVMDKRWKELIGAYIREELK